MNVKTIGFTNGAGAWRELYNRGWKSGGREEKGKIKTGGSIVVYNLLYTRTWQPWNDNVQVCFGIWSSQKLIHVQHNCINLEKRERERLRDRQTDRDWQSQTETDRDREVDTDSDTDRLIDRDSQVRRLNIKKEKTIKINPERLEMEWNELRV